MQLFFSGTAWPAAKVVERRQNPVITDGSAEWRAGASTYAVLSTSGKGRKWTTTTALGWWRTFAELDLDDDAAIADFVRRYGDPFSEFSPDKQVHTVHWANIQETLRQFARLWTDPPEGLLVADHRDDGEPLPKGSRAYEHIFLSLAAKGSPYMQREKIATTPNRDGFANSHQILADFMIDSAFDMVFRKAKMRQCEVCGHWFELRRNTARVCSAACHVRKATEGKRDGAHQQA